MSENKNVANSSIVFQAAHYMPMTLENRDPNCLVKGVAGRHSLVRVVGVDSWVGTAIRKLEILTPLKYFVFPFQCSLYSAFNCWLFVTLSFLPGVQAPLS